MNFRPVPVLPRGASRRPHRGCHLAENRLPPRLIQVDRVRTLLGKFYSTRRSEARGSSITDDVERLSGKFSGQVDKIFNILPKFLEWQLFYRYDLPFRYRKKKLVDNNIQKCILT